MYFGWKSLIPIAQLFDWSIKDGWNKFWIQGIKNWQEEVTFYEALSGLGLNTCLAMPEMMLVIILTRLLYLTTSRIVYIAVSTLSNDPTDLGSVPFN